MVWLKIIYLHFAIIFLLPKKEAKSYQKAFMNLNEECSKYNVTSSPNTYSLIFKLRFIKLCLLLWTEAEIKGCRFVSLGYTYA